MSRYIGNYLRVPSLEPQQSSAPGIWSLSEQLAYQRANVWPPARDPYYNQTVLHLSGDVAGTRETNPVTQPRTFLSDASTNNFLLTPYGDVSARPFNPYLSNYSNYFSGSVDGLTLAYNAAFLLDTNFTLEGWIFPIASANQCIIGMLDSGGVANWDLYVLAANTVRIRWLNTSATIYSVTSAAIALNQWTHVAVTLSGTTLALYVNGVLAGTTTVTGSARNTSRPIGIGRPGDYAGEYFAGYLSNIRYVRGSVVYTGAFTPSTTPLTAISNTALLTCQSNRFKDNSTNNFNITVTGSPRVTDNSPFVSYDTTNGSGYFDGTTDYLTAPASNIVDFAAGQAFTVECWFHPTTSASMTITQGGANTFSIDITPGSSGSINYGKSGVLNIISGSAAMPAGTWNHLVIARNTANQSRMWVNGVSIGSSSSDSYSFNNAVQYIGSNANPGSYFVGYLSNVRVVKGTALYDPTLSSNIIVPTAPLTPVSGTQLLTLQTRAPANNQGILDTSPNSLVVTRTGNVAQGSFSPFSASGWSNYFGGSPDFLSGSGQLLGIGSNDFTVEAWVFLPRLDGVSSRFILGTSTTTSSPTGIYFSINTNGGISSAETWGINVWNTTGLTFTVGTWNHVALCRSGNTARAFLNGVQATNTGSFSETYTSTSFVIGRTWTTDAANSSYMIGNISNLRVISGQALYSGNFTPPTRQLSTTEVGSTGAGAASSITGTVTLLTCQDNRFRDNSRYNRTISVGAGTPSVQPFSQFAPTQAYVASQLGGSAYFDSSGDSLTVPSAPALNMTGDFCMEAWAYPTTAGISFAWKYTAGVVSTSEYFWAIDGTNQLSVALDGGGGEDYFRTAANTITLNAWNHCVITRVGTAVRQFINGVLQSYNTTSRTLNTTSTNFSTSANSGYISGLRIIRNSIPDIYQTTTTTTGTAVFTPPTAPVISVPGTSLLLNFTGAGIVDSTGKNNLETVANSAVQTSVIKYGTGSLCFDGTGDYLFEPHSTLYEFGSGDFTIEFWARANSLSGAYTGVVGVWFAGNTVTANSWYVSLNGYNATNKFGFSYTQSNTSYELIFNATTSTGSWDHYAIVRSGGTLYGFKNGFSQTLSSGSSTISGAINNGTSGLYVGTTGTDSGGTAFNGYISNLRITKYARYTTNFNTNLPPGPFPLA